MKLAGDYWVPDREELQLDALAKGDWQLDHLDYALGFVKEFRLAVDGGAHIGSWTIAMAKRFERVAAFEPAADTYECLVKNVDAAIAAGGLGKTALVQRALGDIARTGVGMAEDGKYHGGNTGGRYLSGAGDIEVVRLDEWSFHTLDFLKLDVEGYEAFALLGAEETLLRCKPVVMIEDKPRMAHRYGLPAHAAADYLKKLGASEMGRFGADYVYGW